MKRVDEVFIPGGMPTETYVKREHLSLEPELEEWVSRKQKPLLSVSGPTKSGKTVLLKRLIPNAVWLSGGAIDSAQDFWEAICDELEVFTDHSIAGAVEGTIGESYNAEIDAHIARGSAESHSESSRLKSIARSRASQPRPAARKWLRKLMREDQAPAIIVDDFHYIESSEQLNIVRGLKDLIFDGLGVIVAAVPHRAYDVVRVEKEMTARVETLTVEPWSNHDLALIARQGFSALNFQCNPEIVDRLVDESFGSPHLMQTHCLELCHENGARRGSEHALTLTAPEWKPFFEQKASATSKSAFDLLKTGPRTRTDRKPRILKSGVHTDIYGAVLAAIEHTGPRTMLTYDEIRSALREVMKSDLPQRHEVTNVLDQMTNIAREKIEGEPVLDYDPEYSTLHLVDPFFAYYLRWAPSSLKAIHLPESRNTTLLPPTD
ncbi:AAA family ATPase [Corynebacterium humireducens]|uniref:AAA family ATPase n=1 Tax=Corynebacterium humireducens TaxID=1223514 RepID=UPI000B0A2F79|nr:AAA family ATPase [Corynebacterium humireducens]